MRWLLLALLIVPALEISVLIWLGSMIGPWWVFVLIILSGILGIAFAKRQGTETWIKARQSMNSGQVPTEQIVDGVCILVGAVFLLAPGLITDTFGLLLIIPLTRIPFKIIIQNWIVWKMSKGRIINRR